MGVTQSLNTPLFWIRHWDAQEEVAAYTFTEFQTILSQKVMCGKSTEENKPAVGLGKAIKL